jgi:hypothetical protein
VRQGHRSIGDTVGEVLHKCGEPTMSIDGWTCNVGPNQFQYRLILENGRVARIESLAEGY